MSIYKDCDIRGIYQKEFDEKEAYLIGKAVGTLYCRQSVVVGGDIRISTPVLKEQLKKGLIETGIHVIDVGTVTTPMFYYAVEQLNADGGIMVTASHNPPEYNGFKLIFGDTPVSSKDIQVIRRKLERREFREAQGSYEKRNVKDSYIKFMMNSFKPGHLKIVVDCCDGTTSEVVPQVLEKLGYDVVRLYCGSDGNFPNRNPNPAQYSCLQDVCKKVAETRADLGAAYDGDGDRVVFIDNKGNYISSEKSFVVFIQDYLKTEVGSVVYDQKCSSVVKDTILKYCGIPLMERSGYGYIKQRFLDDHALMAGEISGHFFFHELGRDDGLFATLKMCSILEKSERSLAEIIEEFPTRLITPDLRLFCPYELQDEWLDKVRELGKTYSVNELDGIRIEFGCGWFLIRKSVTEQAVTIRMEAIDEKSMIWMKEIVASALPELKQLEFFAAV